VVSNVAYNSVAEVAYVSLRVNIGAAAQQSIKAAYNAAGIKLMVSAFGESDAPTTGNADPIAMANTIGQWVLDNNLDGVDVDYEVPDSSRLTVALALTTLSRTLRP
jgi:chitinase